MRDNYKLDMERYKKQNNDKLEKDAERYRWLRDIVAIKQSNLETLVSLGAFDLIKNKDDFDEIIDIAIQLRTIFDISSKEFDLRMKYETKSDQRKE